MRLPAQDLGLPLLVEDGQYVSPSEYRTANGIILPADVVRAMHDRFNRPIVAPRDLIPDSAYEKCGGRVLHLPAPRERPPADPSKGNCCDFCQHFRLEEGQHYIRTRPSYYSGLESFGTRAGFSEDYGLCANDNVADGNMLVSRWAGQDCPGFEVAGTRLSSADPKKGRRLDWEAR